METQKAQHIELKTLELVDLPTDREAIGCHWLYAIKSDPQGKFESAKACIVAQGFTQRPGFDYCEVTSPIIKLDSLRIILALGTQYNWNIHMMDDKGAYLNCLLDGEIYMRQRDDLLTVQDEYYVFD